MYGSSLTITVWRWCVPASSTKTIFGSTKTCIQIDIPGMVATHPSQKRSDCQCRPFSGEAWAVGIVMKSTAIKACRLFAKVQAIVKIDKFLKKRVMLNDLSFGSLSGAAGKTDPCLNPV